MKLTNQKVRQPWLRYWLVMHVFLILAAFVPVLAQSPLVNYGNYNQTLPGYSPTGAGGWSAPGGVILGGGFRHLSGGTVFASFPGEPGVTYPHYTYGPTEYGWNVYNGGTSGGITIHGLYSNMPAGYGILQQTISGFNPSGWAGWSVPAGKVVLGGGFRANGPVAVSAPAGPNSAWPHYTYGANEYGWVVQSAGASEITIYAIYADMPEGYEIVKSAQMNFSATGWAGWSVPGVRKVVTGGGFQLPGAANASYPCFPGQTTPFGYTYGSNEYGWLVQNGGTAGTGYVYAIYANRAALPVELYAPDGTTLKSDYTTIQAAINAASNNDVIKVSAGTYSENININKSLTLKGANSGTSGCGTRSAETIIQGGFTLDTDGITVDGFEFTGTNAQIASTSGNTVRSNITIINNYLHATTAQIPIRHGLGLGGGIGSANWTVSNNKIDDIQFANATAIAVFNVTNATINNNCITHTNAAFAGRRGINADGLQTADISGNTIDLGGDPSTNVPAIWMIQLSMSDRDIQNVTINGNTISNAYFGISTLSQRNVTGVTISNNVIGPVSLGVTLNGGSATPVISQPLQSNINIANNAITTVTPTVVGGIGAAVRLRNLHEAHANGPVGFSNVTVNNNSFSVPSSDAAVINNNAGYVLNATCNWYGTANLAQVPAKVSGPVTYQPLLTSGTDTDPAIGFQPAGGSCQTVSDIVVNGIVTDDSCSVVLDGAVDITVTGGVAPFTYAWDNAAVTEDLTGLGAGTYNVVVTDAFGNTGTNGFTVVTGPVRTWYKDADGDGKGISKTRRTSCIQPVGFVFNADDCNDADPDIYINAPELGDGKDNDCDGDIDEGLPCLVTWYKDQDGDGYGKTSWTKVQCTQPSSFVAASGDCDDLNSAIYPGATEVCDGVDNNCNGVKDEGCAILWYRDVDKDGKGNPNVSILAAVKPTGYVSNSLDCKDNDKTIYTGAPELCDGKDNDCNGLVDDGLPGTITWYKDQDGDGFGKTSTGKPSCIAIAGWVTVGGDCNDLEPARYPGAPEICDGKDNDCDGTVDESCTPIVGIEGMKPENATKPLVKAAEGNPEILISPNPASTEITVTLNGFEAGKKVEMQLVQADGKAVMAQSMIPSVPDQQVRLDVRKMNSGFYLLQVKQGITQQTKKVMIVR